MARTRVVGLDIGTTQVRAAEVAFGGAGPRADVTATLVRYRAVDLPPGAVRDGEVVDAPAVSGALRRMWRGAGFGTRSVVIGVGNQRVVVREIELPGMPLEDLKRSLPFQVADLLPMPVDEALLDFHPTQDGGDDGQDVRGLLVAASRDTVTANLRAVEGAGLRVSMVDLNAFALQRALVRGAHREQTVALVDIGARSTTVVVVARGVPKLVRTIASGGMDVAEAAAGARTAAPREAAVPEPLRGAGPAAVGLQDRTTPVVDESTRSLVESIRNTFVYYASHHPRAGIGRALLTGVGAGLPGLARDLSDASRVPAVLADPLECVGLGRGVDAPLDGSAGRLAVAIGLAHGVAS